MEKQRLQDLVEEERKKEKIQTNTLVFLFGGRLPVIKICGISFKLRNFTNRPCYIIGREGMVMKYHNIAIASSKTFIIYLFLISIKQNFKQK